MSKRVFQKGDAVMVYCWGRGQGAEVWEAAVVVDPLVKVEPWVRYHRASARFVGDPKGRHVGVARNDGTYSSNPTTAVQDIFNTRTLILSKGEYEATKLPEIQAAKDRLAAEAAKKAAWLPNLVDEIIRLMEASTYYAERQRLTEFLRERVRPR